MPGGKLHCGFHTQTVETSSAEQVEIANKLNSQSKQKSQAMNIAEEKLEVVDIT
jgi:hypothetical protein